MHLPSARPSNVVPLKKGSSKSTMAVGYSAVETMFVLLLWIGFACSSCARFCFKSPTTVPRSPNGIRPVPQMYATLSPRKKSTGGPSAIRRAWHGAMSIRGFTYMGPFLSRCPSPAFFALLWWSKMRDWILRIVFWSNSREPHGARVALAQGRVFTHALSSSTTERAWSSLTLGRTAVIARLPPPREFPYWSRWANSWGALALYALRSLTHSSENSHPWPQLRVKPSVSMFWREYLIPRPTSTRPGRRNKFEVMRPRVDMVHPTIFETPCMKYHRFWCERLTSSVVKLGSTRLSPPNLIPMRPPRPCWTTSHTMPRCRPLPV
mmetsp:Transcript_11068/g.31044  ORF Transcript_11068/g.31044 Transcript_11068/m.31044 type:complete len:322 (-) Transcript_11068:348-1313(-)